LRVTIPANIAATIYLRRIVLNPSPKAVNYAGDIEVKLVGKEVTCTVMEIGSGDYNFVSSW
jgi:hypothetical protein